MGSNVNASSPAATDNPSAGSPPALWQRGFWSLFVTQFQGAFSDNLFKFLVIFLISARLAPAVRDQYISAVLAVFSLPFILFSMAGGFLADRYSKRSVILGTKLAEVGVMALGAVGLAIQSIPLLMAVIFLMSVQSAFFGPSKYGSLPELLPQEKLSWGNGMLGLGTFVAIISGGVLAGVLFQRLGARQLWSGLLLVGLAAMGATASLGILKLPPANPQKQFRLNFLSDLWANLKLARGDRVLSLAIQGSVYFWFLGALFGEPTIFVYSQDLLHLEETQIAMLRACLAVGIGLGSVTAGILSGRKIEYGLIPLGAFGLASCAALLSLPGLSVAAVAVLLGLLGFSGGFYIVPINALIQHRPDPRNKGSIIAANAWLTSVGVFLASGAFWALKTLLGLQPTAIFLLGAAVTFLATLYAVKLVPDSLARLLFWMLTHSLYRIRVEGRDHIPARGGALFVCNHLSLADAVLLQAAVDRPIRFIMFKGMYDKPWIRPIARIMRAIPISSELRPREMIKALQTASDAIKNGEVVCIFAEGQITRIGQMLPFRRGYERIMKEVEAPIIPVALDGVWGSIFSFEQGRFLWKMPRTIPYPVAISFGPAMPKDSPPFAVRQVVQEMQADLWKHRRRQLRPLHRAFVRTARLHPRRFCMADATTPGITFGLALTRTVFLARRLRSVWQGQEMVGLLLPPSVPGALVNFAALLTGKVPVNLNYTLAEDAIASCVRQCNIKTVVTSQKFLEHVKLKLPGEVVFLEELAAKPGGGEKWMAFLMAWLLPAPLLERALGGQSIPSPLPGRGEGQGEGLVTANPEVPQIAGATPSPQPSPPLAGEREKHLGVLNTGDPLDRLATVIFSSGSTGEPKGVMLSHYNVASNVEQLGQVFALGRQDRVLGVLPFFHSFGFTGTLCLPAALGVGVAYHANPLDAKTIGQLVHENAVSFVLATPTFLQLYMRGCSAEQFGSVRLIMVGAEKLPDRLATAFEEKFGIRPVEGYGTTECSPAVTVNTHDFRAAGFRQVGAKRGKIGHPLPGMSVRIVDPETREPVPVGQPGLLLVKGPNIMQGYLGKPEKTAEVLIDVASRDGFRAPETPHPGPFPVGRGENSPNTHFALYPREPERRLQAAAGGLGASCGLPPEGGVPPAVHGEGARRAGEGKWYVTGDIAALDEDGFLQITDRLSRFSKIGGEMVPHIKVEEKLHELAGANEQTFAVTGVPDEKKGEKLVVLHKLNDEQLKPVLEKLTQADLPNLWKPKAEQFFHVDALPYLGTGKLDLRKIRELAGQLSQVC